MKTRLDRTKWALFLAILIIGLFYAITVRQGQDWGDDFAMYILHAKNIAQGSAYAETGYLQNPFSPSVGPRTYPPLFPLVLSPAYFFFGPDVEIMKYEIILIFQVFFYLIWRMTADRLSVRDRLSLVLLVGLCPLFWEFKDRILSEILFLATTCLFLAVAHNAYEAPKHEGKRYARASLVGLTMYLAYGTRSIGLVFAPVLVVYELIRFRKISLTTVAALSLFAAFFLVQNVFVHSDVVYVETMLSSLNPSAKRPVAIAGGAAVAPRPLSNRIQSRIDSAVNVASVGSLVFQNGHSRSLRLSVFAASCVFAFLGFLWQLRRQITIYEVFFVIYASTFVLVVFPAESRYLFPLIPLYFCYALAGFRSLEAGQLKPWAVYALVAFLGLTGASYLARYATLNFGPMPEGATQPEAVLFYNAVRKHTIPLDVLICGKPRALALYAERRVSTYHEPENPESLWNYFREIHSNWLVEGPFDTDYWRRFLHSHPDRLEEVYGNSKFRLYRIKSWTEPPR